MAIEATSFKPLRDQVFVAELDGGMKRTFGGILIPDDNMKNRGIRERWGRVYAVGPEVDDLKVGDWVCVEHGRWTNAVEFVENGEPLRLWRVDYPAAVLLVADENPSTPTMKFA